MTDVDCISYPYWLDHGVTTIISHWLFIMADCDWIYLIEKSPKIFCNTSTVTVTWERGTMPFINSSLVELSNNCQNSTKYNTLNGDVVLSVNLGECNPDIKVGCYCIGLEIYPEKQFAVINK